MGASALHLHQAQLFNDSRVCAGTSSIVHETTHQPLLSTLSSIVETVVRLRNYGHRVVLVSSGAIGVGLKRMEIPSRPKSLAKKQVRTQMRFFFFAANSLVSAGTRSCGSGATDRPLGQLIWAIGPTDRSSSFDSWRHIRREFQ